MDAPLSGTSQGYGASDFPFIAVESSSLNDPIFESPLECYFGEDYSDSQCSVNQLFNEPSNAPPSFTQNEASTTPSAPSDCKLQPRVYSRSPSLILSYSPPPSATVVQLQCLMYSTGTQSHEPHHNFSFSDVEARHKNQLPYYPFHDPSKLTPDVSMHHQYLQNSMKLELPRLEIPRSPIACVTRGTASPDSAAMDMSSMPPPATPGTSNASFYWRSTPPKRASFSVPPSPTPSVTKKESADQKMRSSPSKVALRVNTNLLNLHDGYTWKKYGEKNIRKEKYTRSYFKCDMKDRCKM